VIFLLLACAGSQPAIAPPPPGAPPSAPATLPPPDALEDPAQPSEPLSPATPPPPTEAGPAVTPAQMYEGCKERVEGVTAAGECASDADCARAGCSQEVCVAKVDAPDVMSTCELLPCFTALDACGCHDGMCTWTVKTEALLRKRPDLP
jgi:eight-cysteine-cluster-containing protein